MPFAELEGFPGSDKRPFEGWPIETLRLLLTDSEPEVVAAAKAEIQLQRENVVDT